MAERIKKLVAEIPTASAADVREVTHGKWIVDTSLNGKMICFCSQCGSGVKNKETDQYIDLSDAPFCPHCGAEMENAQAE